MRPDARKVRTASWPSWPLQKWPEADAAAWRSSLRQGGPFDDSGPAASLRPDTTQALVALYGKYLAWLDRSGELDPVAGPETRFTHERLGRYIVARRQSVSDNTTFNNLRMLAMMMNCLVPAQRWGWIAHHTAGPTRGEARAARQPQPVFDPGLLIHRLLTAIDAMRTEPLTIELAVDFRDHVMVAVDVYSAVRRRNLQDMRVGHNLIERSAGWELVFDSDETKADEPIAAWIPSIITSALEYYHEKCRPLLLGEKLDCGLVWISRLGNGLSDATVTHAFKRIGRRHLGEHLHPHQVRYVMTATLTSYRPGAIDIAAAALGHKGTNTVTQYYDLAGGETAQNIWRGLMARVKGPR